jgi:hypothetical protein
MGSVNITLANGQLGSTLQTNDGIAGMVLTGVTEGTYTAGTPILITKPSDLAALGIGTLNAFAVRQVNDFYQEAGAGAKLYLLLMPPTVGIGEMAMTSSSNSCKRLLDYAGGKIKLLGLMADDTAHDAAGGTITISQALNADVYNAASGLLTIANEYFEQQKPFRCIVGATSFSGDHGDLQDVSSGASNNRVAILLGDTQSGNQACLGLILGRLAAIPVMRKVSRVRTGPINTTTAYIGTTAVGPASTVAAVVGSIGYITWCTYPNVSGYYFSSDGTCSETTDDYHALARGRVIDKAHVLAYTTFVQQVDDEVPINDDGTLDAAFCKWLSGQIVNQINNTMTARREISSVACEIDPNQNILSTGTLNVVLRIVPVGYATDIAISLGFSNPAL